MEGGIAFSVTMGLLFSLLRYEERAKRVRIIGFSVIGGFLAAALSVFAFDTEFSEPDRLKLL